jgi:multidrug resistance efflux pump
VEVVGFGHVDIEEGTTPLVAPTIGQVAEVLVREGQSVKAGEPMIRLDDKDAKAQLAQAESVVQEAGVRLEQARRGYADHSSRVRQQTESVTICKNRIDQQQSRVQRLAKLSADSALPEESYQTELDKLEELKAAFRVEELKLEQLQLEKPEEKVSLAAAQVSAAQAKKAMAEDHLAHHTLLAPEDGLILRVYVNKGQTVGAGSTAPALWFCADRPRIVRCEIEQEFATRVSTGMRAEILDDNAVDRPRWTGSVLKIGDWIAPRRSMLDEPFQKNDVRTLECIIRIDPGQPPLRIGQRMRVELFSTPAPTAAPAVAEKG